MAQHMAERSRLPIGVFDSGIGGLTVLRVLRSMFPYEDFVFIGDNANNPVGNLPETDINRIALRIAQRLESLPIKMAVIACNTFTAVSSKVLRNTVSFPVVGMCKGVRTAISISPQKSIAVMATVATINSHQHRAAAKKVDANVSVLEVPCPDLAHLVETGHIIDNQVKEPLRTYLQPILTSDADTVVLGCTHFPFLKPVMEQMAEGDIVFVDPSYETANEAKRILTSQHLWNPKRETGHIDLCFTKNIEVARELAGQFLLPSEYTLQKIIL